MLMQSMTPQNQRLAVRLRRHSERHPSSGCVEWTGHRDRKGYGRLGSLLAHRVAYEVFVGPIPEGLTIDHLCENTSCVNPAHLAPATRADNFRRSNSGERSWLAKLTNEAVRDIRARAAAGGRGTQTALAREYGVSEGTVSMIVARKTWESVA